MPYPKAKLVGYWGTLNLLWLAILLAGFQPAVLAEIEQTVLLFLLFGLTAIPCLYASVCLIDCGVFPRDEDSSAEKATAIARMKIAWRRIPIAGTILVLAYLSMPIAIASRLFATLLFGINWTWDWPDTGLLRHCAYSLPFLIGFNTLPIVFGLSFGPKCTDLILAWRRQGSASTRGNEEEIAGRKSLNS
jgi:hypothetical protein